MALNKKSGRRGRRHYVQVDFADTKSLHGFLQFIKGLSRLDVCVNNAGINIVKPVEEVTEAELDRLTDVNYRAPYLISQAAATVMKRREAGRIVNIASIWKNGAAGGYSII